MAELELTSELSLLGVPLVNDVSWEEFSTVFPKPIIFIPNCCQLAHDVDSKTFDAMLICCDGISDIAVGANAQAAIDGCCC